MLLFIAGLLAYQAGTILQQSDRYLDRLSRLLATATKSVGGERLLISLGAIRASENPRVHTVRILTARPMPPQPPATVPINGAGYPSPRGLIPWRS